MATSHSELDGFITELSEHIGKDWMKLARELGLSKTNIDAIQIDNYPYGLEEQIFQFFQKWKQCKGMNATVEMLINGLKAAELNDQLELMKKAGFLPEDKESTRSSSTKHQQNPKPWLGGRSKRPPCRDEICYCGERVDERTVKGGENKGRVYYICFKPEGARCGYYRFQEDERPPHCRCGIPTALHKGQKFYTCRKGKCDFKKWVAEAEPQKPRDQKKISDMWPRHAS